MGNLTTYRRWDIPAKKRDEHRDLTQKRVLTVVCEGEYLCPSHGVTVSRWAEMYSFPVRPPSMLVVPLASVEHIQEPLLAVNP